MNQGISSIGKVGILFLIVIGLLSPNPIPASAAELPPPSQVFSFPARKDSSRAPLPADPKRIVSIDPIAAPQKATVAGVDDRNNSDITGWYVYEHQTITDVMNTANANNLRVVDLYVENSVSPYALTAIYVSNTGSYAKSWWIVVDVTPTALLNFANTNNARITVLKAFDDPSVGGSVKFFAVLVSNTGADNKSWWFYQGQTVANLTSLSQANNARIVQINSYVKNGVTLYDAVMISNTGADATGWWWYVNSTVSTLSTNLTNNNARLIDLDIDPATGNYNAIMTSCAAGCPMWWWWVGVSTSNLLNLVAQDGARIIDANSMPGCGDRCWSIALINNSNAITSRVGQMLRSSTDGTVGLYLKQVGGPVLANLMDGFVFEPASTIKAVTHLYTMRQIQAGTVNLATLITKYVPPVGSSCPGNTANGTENIQTADQEMMFHSDNTRTRELNDYFGTTNVNLMSNSIGLTHTAINHVIGCGGPIADQTTLDDLAVLYDGVARATFVNAATRDLFFSQMAGKAQFLAEGYDWTALWSTAIPSMLQQEAPVGARAADLTHYQSLMNLAYKAGNYKICGSSGCAVSYVDHISIFGWAQIPFCDPAGPRQYVFGTYITNATSDTNSGNAFNLTKAELLREQIHDGLASCIQAHVFLPSITR